MKKLSLFGALSIVLFAAACGGSPKPVVETPPAPEPEPAAAGDDAGTDEGTDGGAAAAPAAAAAPVAPPSAKLSGTTLELSYGGNTYSLSASSVLVGKGGEATIQFNEPMEKGYNQIWLRATGIKKGAPAKLEGRGMDTAFVQLAKGTKDANNVSNSCATKGTITYAAVPKAGAKAKGSIDATITCSGVAELSGPIEIKGSFDGVPVAK